MKPGKFSGQHKREVKGKELQAKLEILALGLAEQAITGSQSLRGIADLEEGLAVLKTLGSHFAMLNKIDGPEAEGNAFDEYKKRVASSGGEGNSARKPSPPSNVVPLTFGDLFPGAGTDEGSDSGAEEGE